MAGEERPKQITRLQAGQTVPVAAEVNRLLKMAGLSAKPKSPAEARALIGPVFEEIGDRVIRSYKNLIAKSNVAMGPFAKWDGSSGARDMGALYNAISYNYDVRRGGDRKLRASFTLNAKPLAYFDWADKGGDFDRVPLHKLFAWAVRHLPNFRGAKNPGPNVSVDVFFSRCRRQRLYHQFAGLYRAVTRRQYRGLKLREHIKDYATRAFERVLQRGGFLSGRNLPTFL